jgi:FKBP-type peptidyl-prolyl cis-trans isomerase
MNSDFFYNFEVLKRINYFQTKENIMIMRGIIVLSLIIGLIACSAESKEKVELKTQADSLGYALGMQLGINFHRDSVAFSTEAFKAALEMTLKGDTINTQINMLQQKQILLAWQQGMEAKFKAGQAASEQKNLADANAFLAQNKTKPGVVTTASGLQYEVMKEGDGKIPVATDTVTVHYKGMLLDGKVFDSSIDKGKPAQFPVNRVIKGWIEGLQIMKEGAKYRFWIHPDLAYGPRGTGPIPPNALLVFEVELIKIIK